MKRYERKGDASKRKSDPRRLKKKTSRDVRLNLHHCISSHRGKSKKKIKRVAALLCKGLQGCYPALWQVCHEAVHLKNLICTQVHKQPASNRSCPGSPRSPPESPLLLNGFCLAVHELDIIMKSKRKRCFSLSLHLSFSLLAGFLHS